MAKMSLVKRLRKHGNLRAHYDDVGKLFLLAADEIERLEKELAEDNAKPIGKRFSTKEEWLEYSKTLTDE